MNVLYLHTNEQDYLSESLFHGLRMTLGAGCVDVPRYDSMYYPLLGGIQKKLRGNGFTLYGLLPELDELKEKRFLWRLDIKRYDLVIVASIRDMWPLAQKLVDLVPAEKLVFLDGGDDPYIFPFENTLYNLKKFPTAFLQSKKNIKYFKRELFTTELKTSVKFLSFFRNNPFKLEPISFSIPEEKITKTSAQQKSKFFPTHIVDNNIAEKLKNTFQISTDGNGYYFDTELDYYADLRASRYGITTKRAGWDCLRHYEIAANGSVICFKDLDKKPKLCAPYGLNSSNSIIYSDFDDLMQKVNNVSDDQYDILQKRTYEWIRNNTTKEAALRFLNKCAG